MNESFVEGYEDLTAVGMKSSVLWISCLLPASCWFLVCLLFNPEDGGYRLLRKMTFTELHGLMSHKTDAFKLYIIAC
jgi:hypothetical protein